MPRPSTRLVALGAAVVATALAAGPAAARVTILDDDAPTIRRALAAGMRTSDGLYQAPTKPAVLARSRQIGEIDGSRLLGRGSGGMAGLLRAVIDSSGAHQVIVDDVGPAFSGRQGDDLAAALASLERQTAPYAPGRLGRRVSLYVSADAGVVLTDPALGGLRTAMGRASGLWLKTSGAAGAWTPAQWLAWPSETARQLTARGVSPTRVHVMLSGGDQATLWQRARTGSACTTLGNGPGGYRLDGSVDAFVAQYRLSFPHPATDKSPAVGCVGAPAPSPAGAAGLVAAAGHEAAGLAIPPGGLVTPPLVAGEPAQVTLQLGADPLGLAAALGVSEEALWIALEGVVQVRGAGVALDAPIGGDGAAPLEFTPTVPGPVTMRLVLKGSGVSTVLGGPADLVAPLGAAPLRRRGRVGPDHPDRLLARRLDARRPADAAGRRAGRPGAADHPALLLRPTRGASAQRPTASRERRLSRLWRTSVTTGVLRHLRISRT